MTEARPNPNPTIIELSKIDAALARIGADRKKKETDINQKKEKLAKGSAEGDLRGKKIAERREKFRREEKSIKEERERLTDRRKALASLNNYKVQQAAEREIEAANKTISLREDALLKVMGELDGYEKEHLAYMTDIEKLKASLDAAVKEHATWSEDNTPREKELTAQRGVVAAKAVPDALRLYERVRGKFPTDAVVPVTNNACPGCFIGVGPQIIVQISRGEALQKCQSCGRILYIEALAKPA